MIFAAELKKLLSHRVFLLIAASVLVLNGYLMFRTANNGEASPSDYREVISAIEGDTDEEKLEWLDEELTHFDRPDHYSFAVLSEFREDCYNAVHYKEFLDNIDAQAETMTKVSIFAKKGTFNYRNIKKTPPAYDKVRGVQPVFDISHGIVLATDNSFTDVLSGFVLLFAVLGIMLADREQGMAGLLFSLRHGRGHLLAAKCGALAVSLAGTVLLLYGENLVISAYLYGLGDLSRPVQSLTGFIGCNLDISVAEYLLIYVAYKFTALYAIGSLMTLVAVNTRNNITFYGITSVVLIAEGLAYKRIEPLSVHSFFRFVNLISFTKINENFHTYRNINFLGYPVPLILTMSISLLIFTALFVGLSVFLCGKRRNISFRRIGLKLFAGRSRKIHSLLYYDIWKSLMLQKGIIAIAVFAVVFSTVQNSFVKKYDRTDVYYRHYTETWEGGITPELLRFCDEEEMRFRTIEARLGELYENGEYMSTEVRELERQLAPEAGFQLFHDRIEKVRDTENAQIFYDSGYKRAFGLDVYDDDMKYALAAVLMLTFLVSPLIASDNKYKMSFIISSTASGRRSYLRRNALISGVYAILTASLWTMLYCKSISDYYSHDGLSAPVRSIAELSDFSLDITVLQYIILVAALRTAALLLIALTMLWVSVKSRSVTVAVLVNSALFALPIIICLLGVEIMADIGASALLRSNCILNGLSYTNLLLLLSICSMMIIYHKRLGKNR